MQIILLIQVYRFQIFKSNSTIQKAKNQFLNTTPLK